MPLKRTLSFSALVMVLLPTAMANPLPEDLVSARIMDMEAADLDGDGVPELILAGEFSQNHILKREKDGRYLPTDWLPRKSHDSEDIAVADFDGDGNLDLVFASEDNRTSEYYLNKGKGVLEDVSDRLVKGTFNATLAIDVDADGDKDLLFGAAGQNQLLINAGDGTFTNESGPRLGDFIDVTQDIEAGDLDGDGDLDLVFGNEDQNRLLLNDGKGFFEDKTSTHLPTPEQNEETREVDFADLDGDGDLDLSFANVGFLTQKPEPSHIFENIGSGVFKTPKPGSLLKGSEGFSLDVDFYDVDADGDLDLMLGRGFTDGLMIYENKGAFQFEPMANLSAPAADIVDMEIFDIDGEAHLYLTNFRGPDHLVRLSAILNEGD